MSIEEESANSEKQKEAVAAPEMDLVSISFDFDNLNIHIENSYKIKSREAIKEMVKCIMTFDDFEKIQKAGFTRSYMSMVNEWCAHNLLYIRNYKRERTRSVDLDQGESTLRKIAYTVLAFFYGA